MGCGMPSPLCGFAFPAGLRAIPACGSGPPPLFNDMAPAAKQVTRPLLATLNSAGQAPLAICEPVPDPCNWTAKSLPSALPATALVIPGISYPT